MIHQAGTEVTEKTKASLINLRCHGMTLQAAEKLASATDSYQGVTLQAAEKLASATDSYQGMTLVMPQPVGNKTWALAPAILEKCTNDLFGGLFRCTDLAVNQFRRGL